MSSWCSTAGSRPVRKKSRVGEERLKDGKVEVGLLGDWDHANEMVHEDGYEFQDSRSVCHLAVISLEFYSITFTRAHGRSCLFPCLETHSNYTT